MSSILTTVGSFSILRCEDGVEEPDPDYPDESENVHLVDVLEPLFQRRPKPHQLPGAIEKSILDTVICLPLENFMTPGWFVGPEMSFTVDAAWFEGDDLIFAFHWSFDELDAPSDDPGCGGAQRVEATGKFLVRLKPKTLAVWDDTTIDTFPPEQSRF